MRPADYKLARYKRRAAPVINSGRSFILSFVLRAYRGTDRPQQECDKREKLLRYLRNVSRAWYFEFIVRKAAIGDIINSRLTSSLSGFRG